MPKETFFNLSEEKQEKVMRATISEFSMHGFEKGNIGDIAKNAGVAKGSMYQYFENKKELFLYSVKWATDVLTKKYQVDMIEAAKAKNMFDYIYETSRTVFTQMRDERELVVFIQDVFLGKYKSLMDESMKYMMKVSDEYVLQLIRHGKEAGYIRTDIRDEYLAMFINAVTLKFKEHMMNRARDLGEDIIDEPFEVMEEELKVMVELMKSGIMIGGK